MTPLDSHCRSYLEQGRWPSTMMTAMSCTYLTSSIDQYWRWWWWWASPTWRPSVLTEWEWGWSACSEGGTRPSSPPASPPPGPGEKVWWATSSGLHRTPSGPGGWSGRSRSGPPSPGSRGYSPAEWRHTLAICCQTYRQQSDSFNFVTMSWCHDCHVLLLIWLLWSKT